MTNRKKSTNTDWMYELGLIFKRYPVLIGLPSFLVLLAAIIYLVNAVAARIEAVMSGLPF